MISLGFFKNNKFLSINIVYFFIFLFENIKNIDFILNEKFFINFNKCEFYKNKLSFLFIDTHDFKNKFFLSFDFFLNIKNNKSILKKFIFNCDIINFNVYNINKEYIGVVVNVSSNFLFIDNEKEEFFVPYVKYKYILNVNFFKKFIIINW